MAAHAPRFGTLDLPRPGRAAAPLLALALVALLLEADPVLRLAGLAACACFALAGLLRATRAHRELAVVRRSVDRLILDDPRGGEVSELVQWRMHELVDPEARDRLRVEVERLVRCLDPSHLPSASPLRRAALRRHEGLLRAIARRLGDERPVAARGILLVEHLLRDGSSPLYADQSDAELARALSRVLGALEP
ncbi:MAG TPA: hypothetical protein VFJ91_01510 [Gaiellaceae bacterium]|nr:hypothetical protein [Gaiellaceae bacterium]